MANHSNISPAARLRVAIDIGGTFTDLQILDESSGADLVAVDMGGTSYDVSLVREGHVQRVNQGEIDNCPVRLPMVEMRTIGSGGGSLAAVDEVGALRVGPQSAALPRDQSLPGPILIEDPHATILIPTGWHANILPSGEIIAVIEPGDRHE